MATLVCRRLLLRRISILQPAYIAHNKLIEKQEFSILQTRYNDRETKYLFNTNHKINFLREFSLGTTDKDENGKKLSVFQRFKQMYRDYWYVLVPVHLVTSVGWFGGFYYLAKSGVDVVALLQTLHISDRIINPLKDSSMGYLAISYALYKIATPFRYTVTLGGTTISINYLKKWGYIRPVPSREELRNMYNEKKEEIVSQVKDKREELLMKKEQFKDRTDDLIGSVESKIMTKIKDCTAKDHIVVKKKALGGKE